MIDRLTPAVRIVGVFGALLLVAAEFTDLFLIRSAGADVARTSAGSHHGYALLVVGLAALGLVWLTTQPQAIRFPALLLLVVGVAAIVVVLAVDLPDLGADGAFGDLTQPATSRAGVGFYLESLGAVLVTLAGGVAAFAPRGA